MKYCSISTCPKQHDSHGYCGMHWQRIRRQGNPLIARSRETHSLSKTPEYKIWRLIKNRCLNPNDSQYYDYGARGIIICVEWENSFTTFLKDIGNRPSPELTLDRENNNLGYEPGNVRWVTRSAQQANRRNNNVTPGVWFNKRHNAWQAVMVYKGKRVLRREFRDCSAAVKARKDAEILWLGAML